MNKKAFKDMVLLIIELAGARGIGATKLNKCLVISDAMYYALHKESYTDAIYIKDKFGPVPNEEAKRIIEQMIDDGSIVAVDKKLNFIIKEKNHTLNQGLKAPRENFTNNDIERITYIVKEVMKMSANKLSDVTHDREYHKTIHKETINLNEIFKWETDNIKYSKEDDEKLGEILKDNFDALNISVQTT